MDQYEGSYVVRSLSLSFLILPVSLVLSPDTPPVHPRLPLSLISFLHQELPSRLDIYLCFLCLSIVFYLFYILYLFALSFFSSLSLSIYIFLSFSLSLTHSLRA